MRNWRSERLELEVEVRSGTADTADMCWLADCRGWTAECGGSEPWRRQSGAPSNVVQYRSRSHMLPPAPLTRCGLEDTAFIMSNNVTCHLSRKVCFGFTCWMSIFTFSMTQNGLVRCVQMFT